MDKEYYKKLVENDLARLGHDEITFHAEEERISIRNSENSISWPLPIGVENLSRALSNIPKDASLDTVSQMFTMYSSAWHAGREDLLSNEVVKEAYYASQGLNNKVDERPSLDSDRGL